jgi:hypothetical protein
MLVRANTSAARMPQRPEFGVRFAFVVTAGKWGLTPFSLLPAAGEDFLPDVAQTGIRARA